MRIDPTEPTTPVDQPQETDAGNGNPPPKKPPTIPQEGAGII